MPKAKALQIKQPKNDVPDEAVKLKKANVPSNRTKIIMEEFAEEIAKTAMPRRTAIKWAAERYGVAEATASSYYAAAMRYLRPSDPEKYREEIIDKNFAILERMLQTALKRGDLKSATQIIRTINQMIGISGNTVEIHQDKGSGETQTITISFA